MLTDKTAVPELELEPLARVMDGEAKLLAEALLRARTIRARLTGETAEPFGGEPAAGLLERAALNREMLGWLLDAIADIERLIGDTDRER